MGNDGGASEALDWQDLLIHIIRIALVSTCPWVRGDVTDEIIVKENLMWRAVEAGGNREKV